MNFRKVLIVLVLMVPGLAFCQKTKVNKKYTIGVNVTVSFTPLFDEEGNTSQTNKLFEQIFSATFNICCQQEIESKLQNEPSLNELARNYLYIDLSKTVDTQANLFENISEVQRLELKSGFKNTDLIIIRSPIRRKEVSKLNGSGSITLSGSVTVFDLRTGEFVIHISNDIKKKFEKMSDSEQPFEELIDSFYSEIIKMLN
ncbi:MAG: hypothetical protein VYB44_02160 [Bacteroidota bacterium]|nr:hypothetical protein [Bacteroidota bacterium]